MNTSKISRRHHYVPQFHLRGFLNDTDSFFLFDKHTGKIYKTNTKNVLFKKDRNITINPDGKKDDWLEKMYSSVELISVPVFNKIVKQKHGVKLNHHDMLSLSLHIATLYWRLPNSDRVSDKIRSEKGFDAIPFDLFHKDGTAVDIEEKKSVLSDENMKRTYRLLLPFASFYDQDYVNRVFNWKVLFNDPGYFLICDNPVIKRSKVNNSNMLDEFIVPLSKECIIINNKAFSLEGMPDEFYVQMGAVMFNQADRFVCGHNKLFLENAFKYYKVYERFGKTDKIIPELFEMIEGAPKM
jgi:Protein of unknown function (DUF4238)